MTDQTAATPEWHDGDPLMAAIAAAVWEHCHTAGTCVSDDPRNIAAAAAAGIRDAARQATGQPDTEAAASPVCECQPVRLHDDYREAAVYLHEATCPTVGQPAAALCSCGDPIQLLDQADPRTWIHSPGSDTDCQSPRLESEAHPPRDRWRLEVWEQDRWIQPRAYSHDSTSTAEVHRAAWLQRRPDDRTRLVRETTTWTVEEDETR